MKEAPLRIGSLGAAHMSVVALVRPSRHVSGVTITAVSARNEARARRFAERYHIPQVHASYEALLRDPALDAVYIPLPNSLHAFWTIAALRAGKHVLCEKPLAVNAREAEQMAQVAAETEHVLVEAMHYRYHPLATRIKAIVDSSEIGDIRHLDVEFSVPLLQPRSIQFRYDLGGGATMDVGCYAIDFVRFLVGDEPQVLRAEARLIRPEVDRYMTADFRFANGCTAHMTCALLSARLLRLRAVIYGTRGELRVNFPFLPHIYHSIKVVTPQMTRHERVEGHSTYVYQLQAFADAVRHGTALFTHAEDAVATMRVIDAVYAAAGLKLRGSAKQGVLGTTP
jgi:predicted dehydrogenase